MILECIVSGVVATLFLDLWQQVLKAVAGLPASNWGMVGRWFAGAARGEFFRGPVAQQPPVVNEKAIGWIGHYATGIAYGFVYVPLMRYGLKIEPSLLNGLVFGIVSVVVPWFFFQPAMGAGVMAKNTPRPALACAQAFASHVFFGVGLAVGAILV
jgi:hypothetical protein